MKHHQFHPLRHPAVISLSLTLGLTLLSGPVWAELPGSNPNPLERRELQPLPNTPTPQETLPVLPALPQGAQPISAIGEIQVNQFKFEGNTVFSEEQLLQAIPPQYKPPRKLTAEQLQDLKNKLTQYYIDQNYINSGVIVPDQEVQNGVVTLKVIEGTLVNVQVSNNVGLRSSYFEKRILGREGEILNVDTLQERLQLLQQNLLLKTIQAELGPGVRLGEGVLKLSVDEDNPYQVQFTFNNHRSPSVGAYRGELELWQRNFTGLLFKPLGTAGGFGDTLYLRAGLTDGFKHDTQGLRDGGIRYDFPWMLAGREITLSAQAERSDSDVVEMPFKQIDIASKADTYGIGLLFPLLEKTPSREWNLGLRLEKRSSETFLLGRPFSFSPGVQDGKSKLTVIRLPMDWVYRTPYDVRAIRSVFSFGIHAFDATKNDDGSPDGEFFTWLGQFQWVGRLNLLPFLSKWQKELQEGQIIVRLDTQRSADSLLPLEKLSMGGANTVRGYRENILTHDNGVISSLEVRFPFPWKLQLPGGISKTPEDGLIQLSVFADYGRAWDTDRPTLGTKAIYSAGMGLRWTPSQKSHLEIYWAPAKREITEVKELDKKDLTDKGLHFEAALAWPF